MNVEFKDEVVSLSSEYGLRDREKKMYESGQKKSEESENENNRYGKAAEKKEKVDRN